MKRENVDRLLTRSLSEAVRERLMRSIAKGELQPGERINEVHLAEACGISRGPIREAARELEGQGFLVSRPNQGFYVKTFTPAQIRDIYEAKDWLEAGFIAEIAAHVDISEREAILAEIDDIDTADIVAFNETLFAFRLGALRRLQNRFLADLMATLYRKFHIVAALVKTTDEREQMARILLSLREFWTAMSAEHVSRARNILLEDTAYWLLSLPARFATEPEEAEIRARIQTWAGGPEEAGRWYRSQPIAAFGGRTAESLVKSGEASALREYLDSIALGGYA